jgi:hypothetical protein
MSINCLGKSKGRSSKTSSNDDKTFTTHNIRWCFGTPSFNLKLKIIMFLRNMKVCLKIQAWACKSDKKVSIKGANTIKQPILGLTNDLFYMFISGKSC